MSFGDIRFGAALHVGFTVADAGVSPGLARSDQWNHVIPLGVPRDHNIVVVPLDGSTPRRHRFHTLPIRPRSAGQWRPHHGPHPDAVELTIPSSTHPATPPCTKANIDMSKKIEAQRRRLPEVSSYRYDDYLLTTNSFAQSALCTRHGRTPTDAGCSTEPDGLNPPWRSRHGSASNGFRTEVVTDRLQRFLAVAGQGRTR